MRTGSYIEWRCTQLHGLYCGYPNGLSAIGDALGLPKDAKKQKIGTALIKTFCTPRNPTDKDKRTRLRKADEPEKWELFKEYNRQDVVSEMAVLEALSAFPRGGPFPVPDEEQRLFELDAEINARGVRIDLDLMQGALICSDRINEKLIAEAGELTGLANPQSVAQLKAFLCDEGVETEKLDKAAVSELINTVDDEKVKRVLKIRKELGKTSVTKYKAIRSTQFQGSYQIQHSVYSLTWVRSG